MNHEEHVSTESLMKICRALQCDIGDIVEITYEKE
jgi:DNA-binding Xre family transcriptional regulator